MVGEFQMATTFAFTWMMAFWEAKVAMGIKGIYRLH